MIEANVPQRSIVWSTSTMMAKEKVFLKKGMEATGTTAEQK